MARYYFHTYEDNELRRDEEGVELSTFDKVRLEAQKILPDIAREEIPHDGDRKTFVVLVMDDDGRPVYTATLAYSGLWLVQ